MTIYQITTHKPIGVFDSGMGGLTVLKALKARLPQEGFIYLGDTARLPYGTKSPETVAQYAIQMTKILINRQIKALVVACNTATTSALPHLQTLFPDLPILGVVQPSAAAVICTTKNHKIAVLATETTIASGAYQRLILETLPHAQITARACSVLVALAEEGMINNAIAHAALKHYLMDLHEQDTLLLGCTHFPVFKALLQELLPATMQIVDSAHATAAALYTLLQSRDLFNPQIITGHTQYLVTDFLKRFQAIGETFLGEPLLTNQIEVIDSCPH